MLVGLCYWVGRRQTTRSQAGEGCSKSSFRNKGRPSSQKWMFFWKSSERGGGSFPIQKITLQILLVSKRYILVVNFGKNVQKGGRGGVIANPKNFIANFSHTYEFSGKKRNVISKKGRGMGGSRPFGSFPKNIYICGDGHP